MKRYGWLVWVVALFGLFVPAMVRAQGFLIVEDPVQVVRLPRPVIIYPPPHYPPWIIRPAPMPAATYKIQELQVQSRIVGQVAQVQVSQSFVNTGSRPLEVSFVFPLPHDGAVDRLTLLVDGREYPARLLKAEDARRMYEDIVRKNKDPALLEWMGAGLFKTSVFPVPPGQKRTISLRYSQLCRKQEGLTDFLFPLSTAKYTSEAVETVGIRVTIESESDIKNVYSPTHAIEIQRPDDRHATVTFSAKNEVPTSDFRLLYDVGKGKLSTRVLSYRPDRDSDKDGYFLLLTSPEIKAREQRVPKTVMFAIDRSGSMSGKKIEQVRAALKFVLDNLRPGDLFNIIAYDSEVETFRPELQKYDERTRKEALGFVEGIYAGGSTNIDGALRTALNQLQDSSRPNYVLFLTDGIPTTGVTNEAQIVRNVNEANKVRARSFAFGVGFDVNGRLLDRLARENHGQTEYVRPNEDIEDRISRLYRRIEAPVMTDVKIAFDLDEKKPENGSPVSRVYPKGSLDLFAGDQLVLVGRYKTPGNAKVILRGAVHGQEQKFDFPARLVEKSPDETNAFVEKLWAVRRVGELLDEIDLRGKNEELVKELVELSLRHGIITPYTSFFADENTNIQSVQENLRRAGDRLGALNQVDGVSGFVQRDYKQQLQAANAPVAAEKPLVKMFAARSAGGSYGYGGQSYGGMGGRGGGSSPGAGMPSAAPTPEPALSGFGGRGSGHRARSAGSSASQGQMPAPSAKGRPSEFFMGATGKVADEEIAKAEQTIRTVGNRAFYRRSGQWIDSTLTEDLQKNPTRIKQFSKEYFDLAKRYGHTLSQYLVFDEPVVINLEGRAYLIEP